MNSIAASDFHNWFFAHGLTILVIIALAFVVTLVARVVVNRFRRKLEGTASITQELNLQRATTLTGALSTALIVVIWVLAILMVLGEFNFNLGPLLASAGVAGVALGFGAQNIVKDTLSGFFILLENQFGVGDNLEVTTPSNKVGGSRREPHPPGDQHQSVRRRPPLRAQRQRHRGE